MEFVNHLPGRSRCIIVLILNVGSGFSVYHDRPAYGGTRRVSRRSRAVSGYRGFHDAICRGGINDLETIGSAEDRSRAISGRDRCRPVDSINARSRGRNQSRGPNSCALRGQIRSNGRCGNAVSDGRCTVVVVDYARVINLELRGPARRAAL